MELIWIGVAYLAGLVARSLKQPPMVGFLAAGFALEALGFRADQALHDLSELGVKLLLFALGLKLDLSSFRRPALVGGSIAHMLASTALAAGLLQLTELGAEALWQNALIGFALAFSSTIFTTRILDARSDVQDAYGKLALVVLILQDLLAVGFLGASRGEWPSYWALGLVALWGLKGPMSRIVCACGHGEMLVLAGITATLGGSALFESVGIKGDLGALTAGLLLKDCARRDELARVLLPLKELFLVGFFLTVGLTGVPQLQDVLIAGLLLSLLPLKGLLFVGLFRLLRLRLRDTVLATVSLGTFSEFGLIVIAVCVSRGWLDARWQVVLAMAIGLSFVALSMANREAPRWATLLGRRYPAWRDLGRAASAVPRPQPKTVLFGLGSVGRSTLRILTERQPGKVLGFDIDDAKVEALKASGLPVARGSATNPLLWEGHAVDPRGVETIVLSTGNHQEHLTATRALRALEHPWHIVVLADYADEIPELKAAGADHVYTYHDEAGLGLASHVSPLDEALAA